MKNNLLKIIYSTILIITFFAILPYAVFAMDITTLNNLPVQGDYIIGPGKTDLVMNPGETTRRMINITNRTGKILTFYIDVEDFKGGVNGDFELLGDERGPYSLKDFLLPEKASFTLAHGEKAELPVDVKVPGDIEPGGYYGAVIIRADSPSEGGGPSSVSVSSRIGSLFFVRINGDVKEEGKTLSFNTDKQFYQKGPVNFSIAFENTGRIHLAPYATIEIRNVIGKKISQIDLVPWYVMPGISRTKIVTWDGNMAFGRYTAIAKVSRGYQDQTDEFKMNFWVVPVKVIVMSVSIIFTLVVFIFWFGSKFELKKKK